MIIIRLILKIISQIEHECMKKDFTNWRTFSSQIVHESKKLITHSYLLEHSKNTTVQPN